VFLLAFRRISKIAKKRLLASSCSSICLSVCMEQFGYHCSDFHEIGYWIIFRKYVDKIQVLLNSDKINGYFICRSIYIYGHISRSSYWNEKVSDRNCGENENTHFMFNKFFFSQNRAVYDITRKNTVQPDRPQMTTWRIRIACWIPNATNTRTQNTWYLLFVHCDKVCTNVPQCYVIRTLRSS
jgi:hypothetical protein